MAKDLWLPMGHELSDGLKIRSLLFAGEDWQIFNTQGSHNILVVQPDLAKRWCNEGYLNESLLGSVSFGSSYYRSLISHNKYRLGPVENSKKPDSKVPAFKSQVQFHENV